MSARVCPQCANPREEAHRYCPSCGFPVAGLDLAAVDPLIGTTLPGGYAVLEKIGAGPMGTIYVAEQTALGRIVAVKLMHASLRGDDGATARFYMEARAASRVDHPNAIAIFDFGKADETPFIVMEYLRGRDVGSLLIERGTPTLARAQDILLQVLSAVAEAHDLGVLHRDLKPENIIVRQLAGGSDLVKVIDFGLAKLAGAPHDTAPSIVCGTDGYMPPERVRGEPADARTDTYACGVILFQLLTGSFPYPDTEAPAATGRAAPDPRKFAPDREISEALAAATMKAVAHEPDARFQTARAFADALRASAFPVVASPA